MRALLAGLVGVLLVAGALFYGYGFSPAPAEKPFFSGVFVSESEEELSWIVLTQNEKGLTSCLWNRISAEPGLYHQENVELFGTASGNRMDVSGRVTRPKPLTITGAAERNRDTIRMTLRADDKVLHTADYTPSDQLTLLSTLSRFKQGLASKAEARARANAPSPQVQEREQKIKVLRKSVADFNAYMREIHRFLNEYKSKELLFSLNTRQISKALEHVRQIPGEQNASLREQIIKSMQGLHDVTQLEYATQNTFMQRYKYAITPYIAFLRQEHTACESGPKTSASPCNDSLLRAMSEQVNPVEEAMAELNTRYHEALQSQQTLLRDAKTVQ